MNKELIQEKCKIQIFLHSTLHITLKSFLKLKLIWFFQISYPK